MRERLPALTPSGRVSNFVKGPMKSAEKRQVARDRIRALRAESYDGLVSTFLNRSTHELVVAASGARYDIEVQAFWDVPGKPGQLRVMVGVDSLLMTRRPHALTCQDFILASDGTFIGE